MDLEQLQNQFIELQEQFKGLQAQHEEATAKLQEKEREARNLSDQNQKLFLKITSEPTPTEAERRSGEANIPKIVDKQTWDLLDEVEREQLQLLMRMS